MLATSGCCIWKVNLIHFFCIFFIDFFNFCRFFHAGILSEADVFREGPGPREPHRRACRLLRFPRLPHGESQPLLTQPQLTPKTVFRQFLRTFCWLLPHHHTTTTSSTWRMFSRSTKASNAASTTSRSKRRRLELTQPGTTTFCAASKESSTTSTRWATSHVAASTWR